MEAPLGEQAAGDLENLDAPFEGAASRNLLQARVQNWSSEPWIRGAYAYGFDSMTDNIEDLAASVDDRLYFAGAACAPLPNTVAVHGAMRSGYTAVAELLASP